jgi:hypothetical protein
MDLPPLYNSAAREGIQDIAWDGEWAYRVVRVGDVAEIQHGLALPTNVGIHWFWRPGPTMPPRSEMVVAAGRRAILRQDQPAQEGQPPENGKLRLLLFDLVDGSQTLIEEQVGVPDRLSVAGCVLDADVYCFWATGKVLKLVPESASMRVESENFWTDLPLELAPSDSQFLGKRVFSPPTNLVKPFFTPDGKIGLAFSARHKVQAAITESAMTDYFRSLDSASQHALIARGEYPLTEELKKNSTVEIKLFIEWDPATRKMQLIDDEKWTHLVQDPPLPVGMEIPRIKGFHIFKNPPTAFQFGKDGKIHGLDSLLASKETKLPKSPTIKSSRSPSGKDAKMPFTGSAKPELSAIEQEPAGPPNN